MNLRYPIASLLIWTTAIIAHAQSASTVKWVSEKENPSLWQTIRADFNDELQPDDPVKVAPVLAYSYKSIYRVAIYEDSAVVIIHHLETEHSKYPGYFSAFAYGVRSHAKQAIKGAESPSVFKFVRFVSIGSAKPPDIFFTWLTCTECEASRVLSAFHYDAGTREWVLRHWEANKDIWWTTEAGPVIWADVTASDTISFDCLHGFLSGGESSYALRCREVAEPEEGKRTVTDIIAKYTFSGADSRLEVQSGPNKAAVLSELCEVSSRNKLCRSTPRLAPAAKQ